MSEWVLLSPEDRAALAWARRQQAERGEPAAVADRPDYLTFRVTGMAVIGGVPAYSGTALEPQPGGVLITDGTGLTVTPDYYPLRELNARADVPIGVAVRAWPSKGGNEFWFVAPLPSGFTLNGWTGCIEVVTYVACSGSRIIYATKSLTFSRGLLASAPSDDPCPVVSSGSGSGGIGNSCCSLLAGRTLSLSYSGMGNADCTGCVPALGTGGGMFLDPDPDNPCAWNDLGSFTGVCTRGFRFHFAPGFNPGEWLVYVTYADTGEVAVVWGVIPAGWDCSTALTGFTLYSASDTSCAWASVNWTVTPS